MDIFFCSLCGFRIKSGQEILVSEGMHHCVACANPQPAATPGSGINKIATSPAKVIEKKSTVAHFASPAHKSTARRPGKIETTDESSKMVLIGAGGAAVVLLGVFLIYMSSASKPVSTQAKNVESKPAEQKRAEPVNSASEVSPSAPKSDPVQIIPTTAPILTPPPISSPANEDIRESYALRKWKDILDAEKNGESPALLKNKMEKFADAYASTKAGKEARERLASFVAADPTPAQPNPVATNSVPPAVVVLPTTMPPISLEDLQKSPGIPDGATFFCDFDKDCGRLNLKMGNRTSDNSFGNNGSSLKSVSNTSSYFTNAIRMDFKEPITIKADTWIRFSCYVEGSKQICLHSLFEPKVCEKFIKNVPQKKWFWVTIKVADYDKQINGKGSGQPDPGSKFRGTSIYTCGGGSICIDNLSIGDGPVPTEK